MLNQRCAVVTGGGRGIGREVARDLAAAGARVALAARTLSEVEAAAAEIRARGGAALAVRADVSRVEDVRALFQQARAELGPVSILVSAAGIAPSATVVKTSDETWHQALETNLSGPFYCLREALPAMVEAGWGRVINVASIAARTGAPYIAAYAASKHGLLGLTRCAALEVAARGVTVNAVCPGYVDTPMVDAGIARIVEKTGISPEQARRHLEEMSPQKRMYTVQEVSALVRFLCTEEARGINGQALTIDGGSVL
jgi:NAD(P)-dependent dehydrogenase (short-subunit alcohol dehydrogenase family)